MDGCLVELIELLANESTQFLNGQRALYPNVGITENIFSLLKNTLLKNADLLVAESRVVYGDDPCIGQHSGWELKEAIYKIVLACMAWCRMAQFAEIPPSSWPDVLTITTEEGNLLPAYQFMGRFLDASTLGVSKARLFIALACCAARSGEPWRLCAPCDTVRISAVTVLFSLRDVTVLTGGKQSDCTQAMFDAFKERSSEFPYVVACRMLSFRFGKEDVSPPIRPVSLDLALRAACQPRAPSELAVAACNAALDLHKFAVGKVSHLLHALGVGHTLVENNYFKGFDVVEIGQHRFDCEAVRRNIAEKTQSVGQFFCQSFSADYYGLIGSYAPDPIDLVLQQFDATIGGGEAEKRARIPGTMSAVTTAATLHIAVAGDPPACTEHEVVFGV